MHDNTDTDAEYRPVTTDDLETLFARFEASITLVSALLLAAVGVTADVHTQNLLFVCAIALMWLGYAQRWSGWANRLWNATLGRASTLHIDQTVEERLAEVDSA